MVLFGRPHGGVGFVCKPMQGIVLNYIDIEYERMMRLQVINNGKPVLNILEVYLPYFDASRDQIELYPETYDILQSAVNNCANVPCIIVGDMNAPIRNWYRGEPFNAHSILLYDFLCTNNMCVGNFAYNHLLNYTYIKGSHRSIILPRYIFNNLSNCISDDQTVDGDEWINALKPTTPSQLMNPSKAI